MTFSMIKYPCSYFLTIVVCLSFTGCNMKTKENNQLRNDKIVEVGGPFENKEFIYYGIPKIMSQVDTSPGWTQQGQKILLTGIIYQNDGKTPASDVLMYYYHTNTDGRYVHKTEERRSMPPNTLGQTHGYIRGWVKTDTTGRYSIYTVRPAAYPTYEEPEHIHVTIKEPGNINEYYIDDFVFDDDKFLTQENRQRMENRCGSGIVKLVQTGELSIGERNITLGLNIPDYPVRSQ